MVLFGTVIVSICVPLFAAQRRIEWRGDCDLVKCSLEVNVDAVDLNSLYTMDAEYLALIADAIGLDIAAGQQQAWHFPPAGGQHEMSRPCFKPPSSASLWPAKAGRR